MSYFPLLLELSGTPCLVAGGGALGAHKAGLLLDSGADVTVVAPEVCPELAALPVKLLRRLIPPLNLGGVRLDLSIMVLLFIVYFLMAFLPRGGAA